MEPISNISDPYLKWYTEEIRIDHSRRLPSRSVDDSSDPFSTILFSDIRQLLIPLRSPRAKHEFRLIWLDLLGLPIPGLGTQGTDDRWALAHLTRSPLLSSIFPPTEVPVNLGASSEAGALVGRERAYNGSVFGPMRNWSRQVLGPLEPVGMEGRVIWTKDEAQNVDPSFVRESFKQMRTGLEDDVEWDMFALAYEAAINVKRSG